MIRRVRSEPAATQVGAAVRAARSARGWSQAELARRSGVAQANVSIVETGRSDVRLSTLAAIARALDLELALVARGGSQAAARASSTVPSVLEEVYVPDPVDEGESS